MKKRAYGYDAIYALDALRKNYVLFLPDILYLIFTAVLALLFLYINDLSVIFSSLASFSEELRSIASSNLLAKFVVTLIIFIAFNLLVGLGTLSLRYGIIKTIIEDKKANFKKASGYAKRYVLSVLSIKVLLLLIHIIPIIVFSAISFVYNPLAFLMLIFTAITLIVLRFVFLFIYPVLFLGESRSPFSVLRNNVLYLKKNLVHIILTGLLVFTVWLVINIVTNSLVTAISSLGIIYYIILAIVFSSLIGIVFILWYSVFLFKNY